MEKTIKINGKEYLCTNEKTIHSDEELIFEILVNDQTTYVIGLFDDMLGSPIKQIWKIL
jgi:hypothetical protein